MPLIGIELDYQNVDFVDSSQIVFFLLSFTALFFLSSGFISLGFHDKDFNETQLFLILYIGFWSSPLKFLSSVIFSCYSIKCKLADSTVGKLFISPTVHQHVIVYFLLNFLLITTTSHPNIPLPLLLTLIPVSLSFILLTQPHRHMKNHLQNHLKHFLMYSFPNFAQQQDNLTIMYQTTHFKNNSMEILLRLKIWSKDVWNISFQDFS